MLSFKLILISYLVLTRTFRSEHQHFLLKMKEYRRITQVALDDIIKEWESLFAHSVQRLHARVRETLASAGIDEIDGLDEIFQVVPSPFEGLETRHKQEKFDREVLQLVVCECIK